MHAQFVAEVRSSAEEAYAAGLYCAESVVQAIARAQGLEADLVIRAATAFCAGVACTSGPCGALSGAIMGVGMALGRSRAEEPVKAPYAATQALVREFEQAFGSRNCSELLGCDLGTAEGRAEFKAKGLNDRCKQYTGTAAEMAARLIAEAGEQQALAPRR